MEVFDSKKCLLGKISSLKNCLSYLGEFSDLIRVVTVLEKWATNTSLGDVSDTEKYVP